MAFSCTIPDMDVKLFAVKDAWVVAFEEGKVALIDRGRLHSVRSLKLGAPVVAADVFDNFVVMLTTKGIEVRSFPELNPVNSIALASSSQPTCLLHPTGYLNKFLVGFANGSLELWNINSAKLIHSFSSFDKAVSVIENSSVIDVIAIGLADGTVWIYDVRQDKALFSLQHNQSITALSFRTNLQEQSLLAVGMADGRVALWDLDSQRLHSTWPAHADAAVSFLSFVHNQPVLVTTAGDNSIKEWIIEGSDYRLLRSRSGHSRPPSVLRFYGEEGESILSGGQDRSLRNISMVKDSMSSEVSQGSIQRKARESSSSEFDLKLTAVTALDVFHTNNLKWDNLITAHDQSCTAQTWRLDHLRIGSHSLPTSDKTFVTAVAMSSCGHFAFVGSAGGAVDMYNIQSGLYRKKFSASHGSVIGLAIDAANTFIAVIHAEGLVRCLDLLSGQLKFSILVAHRIVKTSFHVDSNLLAVALDSGEIHVYDLTTSVLVRRFVGHRQGALSLQFSSDGKWLLSASGDKTLRTWDLSTGQQIDVLPLLGSPTSLSLSPSMDFLAVSFEDDVAIHVWTNMAFYNPSVIGAAATSTLWNSPPPEAAKADDLLCLSSEPRAKYLNLYNLELIKARSKPTLPSPSASQTPFFLDALFSGNDRKRGSEETVESVPGHDRRSVGDSLRGLMEDDGASNLSIYEYLRGLDTTSIDLELRGLLVTGTDDVDLLARLVEVLLEVVESKRDFELVVAILNLSVKIHKEALLASPSSRLSTTVTRARNILRDNWRCLEDGFQEVTCFASFSRDA